MSATAAASSVESRWCTFAKEATVFVFSNARRASLALGAAITLAACSDDPVAPSPAPTRGSQIPLAAAGVAPPGASVSSTVVVPSSMRSSPFNTTRTLLIPPGFTISVYARIGGARFMAVTPDGNLLVSRPGSGSVVLVRPNGAGDPFVTDFATQVIGYWYWLLVI